MTIKLDDNKFSNVYHRPDYTAKKIEKLERCITRVQKLMNGISKQLEIIKNDSALYKQELLNAVENNKNEDKIIY